jgi:hypothetical protein
VEPKYSSHSKLQKPKIAINLERIISSFNSEHLNNISIIIKIVLLMDRLPISILVSLKKFLSVKRRISVHKTSLIYMEIVMNKKTTPSIKKEYLEAIECIIQEF